MSRAIVITIALGAAVTGFGVTALRSPKDQANHTPSLPKPAPAPAAIVKPPWMGPYHITLAWDGLPGFSYRLFIASNAAGYYRFIQTSNTWATVSNLWHPGFYRFAIAYVHPTGAEGPLSPDALWPRPKTNMLSLGLSATVSGPWTTNLTLTNPPDQFYRLQLNAGKYTLQTAPNFQTWTRSTDWPAANPLPTFYLRAGHWDNVTGLEHRD